MRVSYSAINRFLTCPMSYYLHYIRKIPRPIPSWLFFGSCVHDAISYNYAQKIHSSEDLPVDEVLQRFSDVWDKKDLGAGRPDYSDSPLPSGIDWHEDDNGLLKDIGIEIVRNYHVQVASRTQPVAVEMEFPHRQLGGAELSGRVDLIDERGTVIDLKTSRRKPAYQASMSSLQPTFYAAGLGGPVNFKFQYMVKSATVDIVEHELFASAQDISFLSDVILPPIVSSIEKGIFVARTNDWHCSPKYCEFYDVCRGKVTFIPAQAKEL